MSSASVTPGNHGGATPNRRRSGVDGLESSPEVCSPCGVSPSGVSCTKCKEITTVSESSPAGGRNPLLRVCNPCSATDKCLTRQAGSSKADTKKRKSLPSEQEKAAQDAAKKIIDDVKGMTGDQKQTWYRNQKQKRAQEQAATRRQFQDPKAFTQQSKVSANLLDEVDGYITFTEFCKDQMLLKVADSIGACAPLWRAELAKPGAIVTEARGQQLLAVFKGLTAIKRQGNQLETGMKQSGIIHDGSDIAHYDDNAAALHGDELRTNKKKNNNTVSAIVVSEI
jgi:uncharacterized protein CbrC (UPF0167 family)